MRMEQPGQSARSRRGPGPERQPPPPAPSVPHGADPPGGRDRGSTDVTSLCGVLSAQVDGLGPASAPRRPRPRGPLSPPTWHAGPPARKRLCPVRPSEPSPPQASKLRRAEEVVPRHRAIGHLLLEGPADRRLVLVYVGRVDVAVAGADGSLGGLFHVALRHLGRCGKVRARSIQGGPSREPVARLGRGGWRCQR